MAGEGFPLFGLVLLSKAPERRARILMGLWAAWGICLAKAC